MLETRCGTRPVQHRGWPMRLHRFAMQCSRRVPHYCCNFRAAVLKKHEEQAKNFPMGSFIRSLLDHVMCIQFTDVAQGSDRQGGGGILVLDATKGTEVSNPTDLPTRVPSSPGYPLRVILTLFAPHVDVDTQESVVVLLVLASNVARLVIFSGTARRTLVLVRLVMAARSPDSSGRVFVTYSGTGRHNFSTITGAYLKIRNDRAPIVSEFQDVFPEELPGIPPIRDVEFNIELIPGAEPISKAPYRMAPIELKELKDQLQELLERGFIRPEWYRHGAPFLLSRRKRTVREFVWKKSEKILEELKTAFAFRAKAALFSLSHLDQSGFWASLRVEPNLISQIKTAQKDDGEIWAIIQNIDQQTEFRVDDDGILWQGTKLCVPEDPTLREALMTEAHSSPFSIHPGSTKMYHDLKQHFWWSGMKRDVATFVSKCLTCQQVKIEHQRASGLLQPLEIPVWKWDEISMDFVTGLPRTQRKHDAIWVVVDRLTKSAHFLPIRKDYPVSKIAEMFQQEIIRLHGTPSAIVSDRDPRFTSHFWKGLQNAWGTRLKFSTAFHPETDGQSERTIQTLEDMLRSCALEWAGNWDDYICLVEFAYNNSWHASIKCAPFEMLYGRKCRAPICWDQVGERILEGPEMIEVTNEKVAVAREKLKEAQTRQKSYADRHRRALEFQPGEHVFLKVSPTRGVRRFGIKGKLSPRFIGPFEILDRVGEVSYRLALPPQLSHVHNVFHVSLLRGYKYHPLHVVSYPFDQIREDLSYTEEPESILDRQDRVMRNKTIPFVKILWRNHPEREATWETEESIRTSYPHFLP
ncbi:putative nucleotidyltransferase, ribonuclease H [Tanacetum coccineum]